MEEKYYCRSFTYCSDPGNGQYVSATFLSIANEEIPIVSGYGAIGHFFLVNPDTTQTVQWATSMFATSLVNNLVVTLSTAGRIWLVMSNAFQICNAQTCHRFRWLSRDIGNVGLVSSKVRYRVIILLIIESGLFITASKLIEFTLFQLAPDDGIGGLNAMYIPFDCMPQITVRLFGF